MAARKIITFCVGLSFSRRDLPICLPTWKREAVDRSNMATVVSNIDKPILTFLMLIQVASCGLHIVISKYL